MPESKEKIFIKESELKKTRENHVFPQENLTNLETEKFLNNEKGSQDLVRDKIKKTIISEKNNDLPPQKYEKQPVVILPIDKKTYEKGLRKSVNSSLRWLTKWCQRLMKMYQFVYQGENKNKNENEINSRKSVNLLKKIGLIIIPLLLCSLFVWLVNILI
jgi:hypothetical protein